MLKSFSFTSPTAAKLCSQRSMVHLHMSMSTLSVRFSSTSSSSTSSSPSLLMYRILPMPRLSPSMTRATIEKWHLRPAQFANSYQLALEVSTDDLTADAEIDKTVPVNDSDTDSQRKKPRHFLDIEILEDMYVARLLGIEGRSYLAGEPIALFCDDEKDILPSEGVDVTICKDAYQYANGTQMVLWQGFVKENDVNRCSCG